MTIVIFKIGGAQQLVEQYAVVCARCRYRLAYAHAYSRVLGDGPGDVDVGGVFVGRPEARKCAKRRLHGVDFWY